MAGVERGRGRAPKFPLPLPLSTPATQATIQRPAPSWFVDLIRWLIINKPLPMPWSRSVNFRQQHHWKRLLQRRLREQGLRCKLNRILRAEGQFSLVTERFIFRLISLVLLFRY